jgi:hypothetical protein
MDDETPGPREEMPRDWTTPEGREELSRILLSGGDTLGEPAEEVKEKIIVLRDEADQPINTTPYIETTQDKIAAVCDEIKELLITKNDQYGDSAIDPVRIFSKASPEEQLRVRIDDKLSRLVRGHDAIEADDDIVSDLIGYFILMKVAAR